MKVLIGFEFASAFFEMNEFLQTVFFICMLYWSAMSFSYFLPFFFVCTLHDLSDETTISFGKEGTICFLLHVQF